VTTDTSPASSTTDSANLAVSEPDFDIDDAAEPKARPASTPSAPPATPVASALPVVPPTPAASEPPPPEHVQRLLERIEALTKEARAIAVEQPAAAAPLWLEAGRLFEHELGNLRDAAIHYQEAHRADPTYLPVIHAARRLFGQLGKWGMVVMLLDEEIRLPGAAAPVLLIEKARIHESKLARPEDAITIYRQVLSLEPANAIAVDAVVRGLGARGAFPDVVEVLGAAAAAATRDTLKAAWLIEAARLCETRLGDEARALELIEKADALVPNRRPVLEMRRRLAARRGDAARQVEILDALADIATSPADAVGFLMERARVASSTGDGEGLRRAVAALEEARERAPGDTAVLGELCRLYERLEMWSSLADCFEARSIVSTERRERMAWAADAARIAEERLQETERAIRLYRSVIELDPGDQLALSALGRLFARTRRFDDLSHVYGIQIETTVDPQQKIPLLFKHAELLAFSMDDVDGAIARLREILAISPGYVPASKLAATLYTRLGRHADLVELWEAEVATNVDRDQALFLLEKIAGVAEDQLHDAGRAIDAYLRMVKLQPGYLPALRSLARLYTAAERWDDLIRVIEEEAQTVSDQNVIVSLWFRHGEVLADKLTRVDDAITSFNRALQLMPTYLPALKALGGIYARSGRWLDLVAMHRSEADVARRAEQRAHLLFMAAELLETRVGDVDAAVRAYQDVLVEAPAHHPALRALKRIAFSRGDTAMVLATMERELAALTDARERGTLRCQMADLLERAGRVDEAIAALEDAVREVPELLLAHETLVSLLSRHNRAGLEAAARERVHGVLTDDDSRVANLRALADLYLHRLDDPARARDALGRLLTLVPDDRPALRGSLGCALRLRDHRAAITLATSLAAVEPSADEVCNLHLQIATWREGHVDPPEDPLPAYVRILEFQPQHPIALRALERLYVERRAWAALFALYEREAEAISEPRLVVANAMKMGELAEGRLGRLDVARTCYERAHAAMRDYLPAISRLKEIYGKEGRPQDQLRLLTLEAQTSKDPAHAVRTLLEVGALQRDRFGDIDAAVDCFSRVLDRDPLHAQAYPALESLLVGAARWGALAGVYERRADALPQDPTSLPQRLELLSRAALLQQDREKNVVEASRLYERVLKLAPQHPVALLQLGHLAHAAADWDRAIAAWTALLPVAADPMLLVPVHFSLGAIFIDHRPEPARAVQHLSAGLAMQPENRQARMHLARAFAAAGSPAQAAQTYRQLLDSAVDANERRELHLVLARLHTSLLPDAAQAIANLEAALALAVDRTEQGRLLDELSALYERSGNLQGLVDSGTRQAEALVSTQPRRAAELHYRNARIAAERLQNADLALKCARRAAELAPDVIEVRGFIADLYSRAPNQALLAVEEHRRIMRTGRIRVASLKALFKAFSQQRAHDRAFCTAEMLSFIAAADDGEELFFGDNKKRLKKESSEVLEAAQVTSWVTHPAQRSAVREILVAAAPDLGKPFAATDLEALDKKFILRPKAADPLRTLADSVATNLGVSGFDVWRSQTRRAGVEAVAGAPPILLVGTDVTRTHPNREQRFLLARKVMALQSGHHLLAGLDARGLATLLTAIGRSVDKVFPVLAGADSAEAEALTKKVGAALSRKARAQLTEPVAQLATSPRVDLEAFLAAVPLSENRAGLLLSGAFDAAARLVARDVGVNLAGDTAAMVGSLESNPALADLIAYMLSDEHFSARQALKLAIDA
jgi:tetratricopeptide (TPR) repeat protein